jgi:biopolymer transport protein ExbB
MQRFRVTAAAGAPKDDFLGPGDDLTMKRFAGRSGMGLARFAVGCVLVVFLLALVMPALQSARAQGEGQPAGQPAAEKAPAKKKEIRSVSLGEMIAHMIKSAGWFLIVLAIPSIALVALVVLLFLDLRMGAAIPPDFVEEFTDTVNKRKFKEAFELCRSENSYLARVLTASMARLQYGVEDAREVALNTVESIRSSKDSLINYLATIGTLGPMIGLVGTVWGMIKSFMVLARPGEHPDAAELSEGISEALVITLLGIAISIPAIFFHASFRNRLTRISMDTGNIADDLLTQMYHNSRRSGPAETRPATGPVATVTPATPTAAVKPG